MAYQFLDRFPEAPAPQPISDDIQEIIDTDEHVRAIVARAVELIELCGRTLPTPRVSKHRYSELVEGLKTALEDDMPAPREHGDDPFA